jgi:hypothetical protein
MCIVHTGNASRDDNDVCVLECGLGPVVLGEVTGNFLYPSSASMLRLSSDVRTAGEEMWERSAATPGVLTTSYNANSEMRGEVFKRRDNGC